MRARSVRERFIRTGTKALEQYEFVEMEQDTHIYTLHSCAGVTGELWNERRGGPQTCQDFINCHSGLYSVMLVL